MEPKLRKNVTYEFGEYRLDTHQLMLFRNGQEIALPPKAVETLTALIEKRGEIVSKDELMATIWEGSIVEESNLSRYIHLIRSTLGKRTDGTEYIETFRRRGYRFSGSVDVLSKSTAAHSLSPPVLSLTSSGQYPRVTAKGNVLQVADWQPQPENSPLPATGSSETGEPHVQPKRRSRYAVFSIAAVGLIATVAGFFGLWPSKPVLTDKDVILIADFENRTGDEVFDHTLRRGLSIQLQQSPFLSIFPDERIRETLRLMQRKTDEPLSREVAAEICQRQGLKAYIVGAIDAVGNKYLISIEAIDGETKASLASVQVDAPDTEGIIEGLSRASTEFRERLGESLASLEKRSVPLSVTTPSLDALKMYSVGSRHFLERRNLEAITFFKRAIELDPNFAIAHSDLSLPLDIIGRYTDSVAAARKGLELAEGISEYERLRITDTYHNIVTYDVIAREELLTVATQVFPRDPVFAERLASIYNFTGQYDKAIEEARRAVSLGSVRASYLLAASLFANGDATGAREVLYPSLSDGSVRKASVRGLVSLGIYTNDPELVSQALNFLENGGFTDELRSTRLQMAVFYGELSKARTLYQEQSESLNKEGRQEFESMVTAQWALSLATLGECNEALALGSDLATRENVSSLYTGAAIVSALCGDCSGAERLIGIQLARLPQGTVANRVVAPQVRGINEFVAGRFQNAIMELNSIPSGFASRASLASYIRANSLLRIGDHEAAAAEFRRLIDHPGWNPNMSLTERWPLAFLGLGRAKAAMGNADEARAAYERFFEIWKNADADIPELKKARQEYADLQRKYHWQ